MASGAAYSPDTRPPGSRRIAGIDDPDRLTREGVQDVYDELDRLIAENEQ